MNNKHPQKPMSPAMRKHQQLKKIFISLIVLGGCILGAFVALTVMRVTGFMDYLYGDDEDDLFYEDVYEEAIYLYRIDGSEKTVDNVEDFYEKTDASLPAEERWYTEPVKYAYAVYEKDDVDPRGYSNKYAGGNENEQTIVTYGMENYDNRSDGILYYDEPHIYVKVSVTEGDVVTKKGTAIPLAEYEANTAGYELITVEEYGKSEQIYRCNYCFENHKTTEHICTHCGGKGHQSNDCCTICQSVNHTTANHVCERCGETGHGKATCKATICDICGEKGHDRSGHTCTKCNVKGHGEKDTHCKDCGKYGHADKKDNTCEKYVAPKVFKCDICGEKEGLDHDTVNHPCETCGEKGHGMATCKVKACDICGEKGHDKAGHICTTCKGQGHGEKEIHCKDCGTYGHADKTAEACKIGKCPVCGSAEHEASAHVCDICGEKGHDKENCKAKKCSICLEIGHEKSDHVCEKCGEKGHAKENCNSLCEICGEYGHKTSEKHCDKCKKYLPANVDHCSACCGDHSYTVCPKEGCEFCGAKSHAKEDHVCEKCKVKGHGGQDTHCKDCGMYGHENKEYADCPEYGKYNCEYCGENDNHDTDKHVCKLCVGEGHDRTDCPTRCAICGGGHPLAKHQCGRCGRLGGDYLSKEFPCDSLQCVQE